MSFLCLLWLTILFAEIHTGTAMIDSAPNLIELDFFGQKTEVWRPKCLLNEIKFYQSKISRRILTILQ